MLDLNLSRYIWTHTKQQQIWILAVVAASMVPYFMAFNLPKMIVNGPIQGGGFETPASTQLFGRVVIGVPGFDPFVLFSGMELERLQTLFALSAVFLALVLINGLFKFYINTYKGRLGERLLRRLRFSLVDHILRFPPAVFKRTKSAEISSMIKDEIEPMGGFTGDAFVAPALLGGQALTALVFIFVQSVALGAITASLVALQIIIIPRMRRRLLVLGRERQLTARELAGRISEIVDGIGTIHGYDTSNYERADIARRLGRIFRIRFDLYRWKFMVKFINNILASLTPFLFYSIGGYLALTGRLDIGQLVAVIGAYKDLPGPLKELIDWDQNRQDVQLKYQQVISQFSVEGLMDPAIQKVSTEDATGKLQPPLTAINLGVADDSGGISLERANLSLSPGETMAIVGVAGSGSDTMAEVLGRVIWPSSGKIMAGSDNLLTLPEAISGRSITYVSGDGYFFSGSVLDNLFYGLKNAPRAATGPSETVERKWERTEAALAGNPDSNLQDEWIDYASLGLTDQGALLAQVPSVLDTVSLTQDLLDLAMRSTITPTDYPGLADKIIEIRKVLRVELAEQNLSELIVPFEPGAYNAEATVIENLLFGAAKARDLMPDTIGSSPYFCSVLAQKGLDEKFVEMGAEVARTVIGLFSDLPADHPFFRQLTVLSADDIPAYAALLQKVDTPSAVLTPQDRASMMRLAFEYIEPRLRFGLLTPELKNEIVAFREHFHANLPAAHHGAIEMYDPDRYFTSGSLLDNMLFGRISQKYRDGADRIRSIVAKLLQPMGIDATMLSISLAFDIGPGGKRLSAGQRQKLGLARALLRKSDFFILNRPLLALDGRAQERILGNVLKRLQTADRPVGVAWVVASPQLARHFDRVAVFSRGILAEDGTPDQLMKKNGIFAEMIAS